MQMVIEMEMEMKSMLLNLPTIVHFLRFINQFKNHKGIKNSKIFTNENVWYYSAYSTQCS